MQLIELRLYETENSINLYKHIPCEIKLYQFKLFIGLFFICINVIQAQSNRFFAFHLNKYNLFVALLGKLQNK